jgi:DNA polymerase (family 10)
MELEKAERIAKEILIKMQPFCQAIEIVGSIRRRRPFVNDIDIVCIPENQGQLIAVLMELGHLKVGGQKIIRIATHAKYGIDLDCYIATPATWATLKLIRTGSAAHNVKLCSLAKQKGMKLHADGSGLFRLADCAGTESRIAGNTEESIFEALGLRYVEPIYRQ